METITANSVEQKIQAKVDDLAKTADERGTATLSVCDAFGYGWDRDYYNFRNQIASTLRNRGYDVSSEMRFRVIDITVTKRFKLS